MAGMVDVNASLSGSASATSGGQVSANSGGVFYKSNPPKTPWLAITLAGIAAVVAVVYLIRK